MGYYIVTIDESNIKLKRFPRQFADGGSDPVHDGTGHKPE
jgi:hypothetical protein